MFKLCNKEEKVNYKQLVKNGAVILDVRSAGEFASGHIKGAINIPLDTLFTDYKKFEDKSTHIITCCLSGGRSTMAQNILSKAGFTNVYNGGGWYALQSKLQ